MSPVFNWGAWQASADFRYMSRLDRVAVYPADERVPTKVWDARLGYRWNDFTLQLVVRNALNYNYTISERVLGEIRNVALSIQGEF